MADIRLVDLEVIKRYSLAIRQETAPAAEVLAALDASRSTVLATMTAGRASPKPGKKAAKKSTKKVAKKATKKAAKATGSKAATKATKATKSGARRGGTSGAKSRR